MKIPEELKPGSNEEIKRWWIEGYKEKAGLLHQINWHRIILDGTYSIALLGASRSTDFFLLLFRGTLHQERAVNYVNSSSGS